MKSNIFNKNRYFELLKSNNELLNYKIILESSIIYNNRHSSMCSFKRAHR